MNLQVIASPDGDILWVSHRISGAQFGWAELEVPARQAIGLSVPSSAIRVGDLELG